MAPAAIAFIDEARAFVADIRTRHALEPAAMIDSAEMARRIAINPHNLPRVPGAPAMCPAHAAQARCEDEGRRAYPGGRNPYMRDTAAANWWARGWHQADAIACPEMQA